VGAPVIAGAAAAVYFRLLRPWHLNWGATPEEASGKVAGDELIPEPGIVSTRVVEIDAPASAIWPWLVVVRSSNHAWVWSFELRPAGEHSRLISRNRFDAAALPWKDKLAYPVIEPGSWVMERKMLLTIKQLAEHLARTQPAG
jgi:hypothetical protein